MRIVGVGQGLFAIATASLALWSLEYGEFAWGAVPWRETWVYASALSILAASTGLWFPRTALPSVLTIGVYQALGAAIAVPQILSKPLSVGAWYPFCEALTALTGASLLYAMLRWESRGPGGMLIASRGAVRIAQVLYGLTCVFYGGSHFLYADYTAVMVPGWLPGHVAFAYLTGVGHLAAGIAIIFGILPRLAAVLEAVMMSLFGLLVWVPSAFEQPRPQWATPPEHQWSELAITLVLAASAWIVAISLGSRSRAYAVQARPV